MDIKILTSMTKASVAYYYNERRYLVLGTHNGIFHSDEVVAIAILCLYYKKRSIRIVRTRDADDLATCDICVDIGGGEFDHHQPGFDLTREDGTLYASAGLVWKEFGEKLICKYWDDFFQKKHSFAEKIFKRFDKEVISLVDCEDNEKAADKHCFSFISSFLPLWNDDYPDYDKNFGEVLNIVMQVLEKELLKTIQLVIAEEILDKNRQNPLDFSDNILKVPSQTMPWEEAVVNFNDSAANSKDEINFVIFQYPAGGWAAQCVPPSLEKKFEQKIPFPKEWAGLTDEKLAEISTVKDAIFCHNGRFFVRAKSKDGVIKMCKLAMEAETEAEAK